MIDQKTNQIIQQFGNVGNLSSPPGSLLWAIAVRVEMSSDIHDLKFKAEQLKCWRDLIQKHQGWRQLLNHETGRNFQSYEELCRAKPPFGLGIEAAKIDQIISLFC